MDARTFLQDIRLAPIANLDKTKTNQPLILLAMQYIAVQWWRKSQHVFGVKCMNNRCLLLIMAFCGLPIVYWPPKLHWGMWRWWQRWPSHSPPCNGGSSKGWRRLSSNMKNTIDPKSQISNNTCIPSLRPFSRNLTAKRNGCTNGAGGHYHYQK